MRRVRKYRVGARRHLSRQLLSCGPKTGSDELELQAGTRTGEFPSWQVWDGRHMEDSEAIRTRPVRTHLSALAWSWQLGRHAKKFGGPAPSLRKNTACPHVAKTSLASSLVPFLFFSSLQGTKKWLSVRIHFHDFCLLYAAPHHL